MILMVEINIDHFGGDRKKKAVTLYLTADTFSYVKDNLTNQSVSAFVDDILRQVEKIIKDKKLEEEKKKIATDTEIKNEEEKKDGEKK